MTTTNAADACCPSCATAGSHTALAVACTLDAPDFEERVASIRHLASRYLRSSHRGPLALHLTYSAEAMSEVEEMVAKESACCAFLDFDIRAADQIELTITASESAALAADEVFAHFAPELARAAA